MEAKKETRPRPEPSPQAVKLTVVAQDPLAKPDRRILKTQVRVPAEQLEPGPRGARFHVVDYDPASGEFQKPAVLRFDREDPFADEDVSDETLVEDPTFRAQNVYAIAARTLAAFEGALGRRIAWGFEGHQLFLVPRAFPEANAYYDPEDGAIYFGFIPTGAGSPDIQSALSHDIITHETTHAVLDGLRRRYLEPALPDQDGFHEALGDIVALLSVFSLTDVVSDLVGPADRNGKIDASVLDAVDLAQTPLLGLAEEFGMGISGERGSALRRSIEMPASSKWREDLTYEEPHLRGEVLVAATMRTLLAMWTERLGELVGEGKADRVRVAEDGAKAASHLLGMMIRGIDYMPSVELEFEDVLGSVLAADEVVAPDDEHRYREALTEAFASYGIDPHRPDDVTGVEPPPAYERMNFELMRSDPDEMFRFIWDNAEAFSIERAYRTRVDAVRPAVRIGPDGLVVGEVVVSYVQSVEMTGAELARHDVELPAALKPEDPLQLRGGGALVFDQFGGAKFHQSKPLGDWKRQERRLQYLVRQSLRDRSGRFGFSVGGRSGQRFAAMHISDRRAGEEW